MSPMQKESNGGTVWFQKKNVCLLWLPKYIAVHYSIILGSIKSLKIMSLKIFRLKIFCCCWNAVWQFFYLSPVWAISLLCLKHIVKRKTMKQFIDVHVDHVQPNDHLSMLDNWFACQSTAFQIQQKPPLVV